MRPLSTDRAIWISVLSYLQVTMCLQWDKRRQVNGFKVKQWEYSGFFYFIYQIVVSYLQMW